MTEPLRVVLDTNIWISRLLAPSSVPAHAATRAVRHERLLVSDETLRELATVLARPKFDPYVSAQERQAFLNLVLGVALPVPIVRRVRACRDPKDDKFLELALAGEADCLITGDADLLALHPFEGIAILPPAGFLTQYPR